MIDPEGYVYERCFDKLKKHFKSLAVTDEEIYTPSSLPCVSLVMADNPRYEKGDDSSGEEKFTSVMFEASVYANGKNKKKACKEIFDVLDKEMTIIGFKRTTFGGFTQHNSSIYRIVARYTAICGKDGHFYWR